MYPSSTLCRTQEAHQRALASGTALDNVRRIAERAATAWANEAVVAERREARQERMDGTVVAPAPNQPPLHDQDRLISENPDRGFAD
jgi:hypothetical protein